MERITFEQQLSSSFRQSEQILCSLHFSIQILQSVAKIIFLLGD
jgi:hypothetical protein